VPGWIELEEPPMKQKLSSIIALLLGLTTAAFAQTEAELKLLAAQFPPMPRNSTGLIPFVGGLPTFSSGTPFNDVLYTLIDTDYIDGENGGFDTFMPVDPADTFPGANKVKLVRCALNTDLDSVYGVAPGDRIILGTAEIPHPFFLRGADGVDNDYAAILHFDFVHGHIQLRGHAADYRLIFGTLAEGCRTEGWYLFYTEGGPPDLIAFIFPCDVIEPAISGNPPNIANPYCNPTHQLSLTNAAQFRFALPISTQPAVPGGSRQFGSPGKDLVMAIAVDAGLNSYLVGCTDGNFDADPEAANELFIAKIAPDYTTLWVRELPVGEGTNLKAAAADGEFLYVAGRTLGSLPGFNNAGRWDGILLKLRLSDGVIVAMDQWGNAGIDGYGNVVLDGVGNLFVSAQGSPPGPASNDDAYLVAKHRTSDLGNVWRMIDPVAATGFAASAEAWGGLTFVPGARPGEGRLIVAGWYMSSGGAQAFAAVYENLTAATPTRPHFVTLGAPGQKADWFFDSAVDSQGRIYFVGYTTGNLQGTQQGEGDAFIARYSSTLSNPIIRQFGTARSDMASSLELDAGGNLHVLGYTYGSFSGGTNADPTGLTGDLFIQTFDLDLNPVRSRQFGTPGEDRAAMKLFGSTLFIGGTTEGSMTGPNHGSFDGFTLRLSAETLEPIPTATLEILSATQLRLRATPASSRWQLQQSSNLTSWADAPNLPIVLTNGTASIPVMAAPGSRFYRVVLQPPASTMTAGDVEARSGLVATDPVLGDILRTPSERFTNLPAYPFPSHYVDVGDTGPVYLHYLDEGPTNGPVVLLAHGNPAWSYLVREMIPPLTAAGFRVVAPDLIGFGKSDKPVSRAAHTYDNHVRWLSRFVERLDLRDITLHCQDWGGLILLRVAIYQEARFARIAASNTSLPDGNIGNEQSFSIWRDNISQNVAQFSLVMENTTPTELTTAERAAYDAPFPSNEYTAGPRGLPFEVPFDPADPEAIENQQALILYESWTKPLMTVFTESARGSGSVTDEGQAQLQSRAPGAAGQPHLKIPAARAGHYLQEDIPAELAQYLVEFVRRNP
jgi:pimeloyl-ACP methyl ester carboxylesterase